MIISLIKDNNACNCWILLLGFFPLGWIQIYRSPKRTDKLVASFLLCALLLCTYCVSQQSFVSDKLCQCAQHSGTFMISKSRLNVMIYGWYVANRVQSPLICGQILLNMSDHECLKHSTERAWKQLRLLAIRFHPKVQSDVVAISCLLNYAATNLSVVLLPTSLQQVVGVSGPCTAKSPD